MKEFDLKAYNVGKMANGNKLKNVSMLKEVKQDADCCIKTKNIYGILHLFCTGL